MSSDKSADIADVTAVMLSEEQQRLTDNKCCWLDCVRTKAQLQRYPSATFAIHKSRQISSNSEQTYNVAGREVPDGILGGERHRAEHDEDEDEVGEDVVIDELVAEDAEPGGDTAQ